MRNLNNYIECETFAPLNTLGAGNPGFDGETISELIQDFMNKRPKAKKEKIKKRNMKTLKEQLNESLLNEAKIKPISVSAYNIEELIEFAADFNPNTKNEEEWLGWNDYHISTSDWRSNKTFYKKFCNVCKNMLDHVDYGVIELGNFPDDKYDQMELLADEFNPKDGDTYHFLTADGDNGIFFYIEQPLSDSATIKRTIDDFMSMTVGHGYRDWESIIYDSSYNE